MWERDNLVRLLRKTVHDTKAPIPEETYKMATFDVRGDGDDGDDQTKPLHRAKIGLKRRGISSCGYLIPGYLIITSDATSRIPLLVVRLGYRTFVSKLPPRARPQPDAQNVLERSNIDEVSLIYPVYDDNGCDITLVELHRRHQELRTGTVPLYITTAHTTYITYHINTAHRDIWYDWLNSAKCTTSIDDDERRLCTMYKLSNGTSAAENKNANSKKKDDKYYYTNDEKLKMLPYIAVFLTLSQDAEFRRFVSRGQPTVSNTDARTPRARSASKVLDPGSTVSPGVTSPAPLTTSRTRSKSIGPGAAHGSPSPVPNSEEPRRRSRTNREESRTATSRPSPLIELNERPRSPAELNA